MIISFCFPHLLFNGQENPSIEIPTEQTLTLIESIEHTIFSMHRPPVSFTNQLTHRLDHQAPEP